MTPISEINFNNIHDFLEINDNSLFHIPSDQLFLCVSSDMPTISEENLKKYKDYIFKDEKGTWFNSDIIKEISDDSDSEVVKNIEDYKKTIREITYKYHQN